MGNSAATLELTAWCCEVQIPPLWWSQQPVLPGQAGRWRPGGPGSMDLADPCVWCGRALVAALPEDAEHSGGAIPRHYLFPSGHTFHGACFAAEAMAAAAPQQRATTEAILGAWRR